MIQWVGRHDGMLVGRIVAERHNSPDCRCAGETISLQIDGDVVVKVEACCYVPYTNVSRWYMHLRLFERETGLSVWHETHANGVINDRIPSLAMMPVIDWPRPIFRPHWKSVWYLARQFAGLVPVIRCSNCRKRYRLSGRAWLPGPGPGPGTTFCTLACSGAYRKMSNRQWVRLGDMQQALSAAKKAIRDRRFRVGQL